MSKKISINPDFFKISGSSMLRGGRRKKQKPIFNKKNLRPNDIKKKLIARIKAHQKKEKEKLMEEKKKEQDTFKDEFKETLAYLEEMKKKKKKQKEKKKTLKKSKKEDKPTYNITPNIPIHTGKMDTHAENDTSTDYKNDDALYGPEPPYGCLKGGSKPTWKQWNKTLKKDRVSEKPHINENKKLSFDISLNKNPVFEDRQNKLQDLKSKFQIVEPINKKIRTRRIRRKITLGKQNNKIGVLVKSKQTRKKIKNEVDVLKKKSIQDVKEYLRKHNLFKIGSNAPDYLVRSIYENAYLSGDIKNKNPEILLHNWKEESIK